MALQMCLFMIILLHTTLINHTFTKADPTYLDSRCSNNMLFAPNSKYQTDLNTVLLSLNSKAATTTSGTSTKNSVYGLFLCHGDLTTTVCKDCVVAATLDLSQSYCPMNKVGVIWYADCMVRYSNESFFDRMDDSPKVIIWNSHNMTGKQTHFTEILDDFMNDLVVHTSNNNTFYANVVKIRGFWSLRAFSQCTPDLTRSDCTRCLKIAVSQLPVSLTGRVLQPSCNVWYEVYKSNISSLIPSNSEIKHQSGKKNLLTEMIVATLVPVASVSVAVLVLCLIILRARKLKTAVRNDIETLRYDLATLLSATNNFSEDNRLSPYSCGVGVFKGILPNEAEIAVKRVSNNHYFSDTNFINGVLSHAKLQHRNLLKLLGFCVDGEDKFLIFEYMPYKLTDFLLATEEHRRLGWETRFQIIKGIARGLLYLHQDSRLQIVHRHLACAHVLLDEHMNPKIADFSIAKILHSDQTIDAPVCGTIGYICREYMTIGRLSVQTDVYSFGIVTLEIIGGTTYHEFRRTQITELTRFPMVDFTSYAREKWRDDRVLEFVDEAIRDSVAINEIKRCVHLGLLCAEDYVVHRPTMAKVVVMLESHPVTLPKPEQPAYMSHDESNQGDPGQSASMLMPCSLNNATITELEPR